MLEKTRECFLFIVLSFCVGFLAGYSIFSQKAYILQLLTIIKFLTLQVLRVAPRPNFLSDVAAFEAVLISIAIPLSFEIVSRISERYQSDVVTNMFWKREWIVRWLPLFLMLNIVIAIMLRFFVQDSPDTILWKAFAWLTILGFLFVTVVLIKFFILLKNYMTETEFVLNRLFDEAHKSLKS